ncbi:MAG: nucleotidyltransferase domain-containing protein [Spirochaetales bacterium]|nr:nucleotidyltransferase domain-containing protein [Spirochaetales bacterium]
MEKRVQEAWQEVAALVEVFKTIDPKLKRIVLFGSLSRGTPSNPNFDIDLSFEGDEYYRCVSSSLTSPFSVDLVDYGSVGAHIKEAIDRDGKVIYKWEVPRR